MSERRGSKAADKAEVELELHRLDTFAHQPMMNRVLQENVTLREKFENRLSSLEQFRAQAVILGGLGFLVLGAVTSAVAFRMFGA